MVTTTVVHWVKILVEFLPNFSTWAIIGKFDNFGQNFKLSNVILDQFMDCNAIIDHYTHMAVHKLDLNCVLNLKFSENFLHMAPLDSSECSLCLFFQFWPPGALLAWFPKKSEVGGDIMVNHKNGVEKIFFSLFQPAFKCNFGPICGL